MTFEEETRRATELLKGKVVEVVFRHRAKEMGIQFTDGTRLFVDFDSEGLELSVTEGCVNETEEAGE